MYELSENVNSLTNLAFGAIGVWMAHALYKTPRGRRGAVLAWGLIYIFLILFTTPLHRLLPGIPYVRMSMLLGFCGIFAYLYLFPGIPVQQRVFTYFMVDTSMLLLMLFARTTAQLAAAGFQADMDRVFLCLYLPAAAAFVVLFRRSLRAYILSALRAFESHLTALAVFAAGGYVSLMLVVDPWAAWPAIDVWRALGWYGLIAFVSLGYLLAFRTLTAILAQQSAQESSRRLEAQIAMSEQYYQTLVQRVEQSRTRDHDLRHHINALQGLCREEAWGDVAGYVRDMGLELPPHTEKRYTEHGAVNALLDYYGGLCESEGIPFRCLVRLPELGRVEPLHLCVILGNALQNALEASLTRMGTGGDAALELRAAAGNRQLVISVENKYAGEVGRDAEGHPVSSKAEPGHGLGLASIRETVRRYGGWCAEQADGEVFRLRIVLPMD